MGRASALPVAIGDVLDGKYAIEGVIGEGGMGVVARAYDRALDRRVAVKVMRAEMADDNEAILRFDREGRASAALRSRHVARVFDLGRTDTGAPYMVMELLVGSTLKSLIEARRGIDVDDLVRIAIEVTEALGEAHALGIIHRDLKPGNIFVVDQPDQQPLAKVLDFGIAKVSSAMGEGSITTTGSMLGTPWYMAPEQLDTKRGVTAKTDVWALGATMYYALTRKTPFEADTVYELSVKIYAHDPTPITTYRDDLPSELVGIIHGCLTKDANKRLALADVRERLSALRDTLAPVTRAARNQLRIPSPSTSTTTLPALPDTHTTTVETPMLGIMDETVTPVELTAYLAPTPSHPPPATIARASAPFPGASSPAPQRMVWRGILASAFGTALVLAVAAWSSRSAKHAPAQEPPSMPVEPPTLATPSAPVEPPSGVAAPAPTPTISIPAREHATRPVLTGKRRPQGGSSPAAAPAPAPAPGPVPKDNGALTHER